MASSEDEESLLLLAEETERMTEKMQNLLASKDWQSSEPVQTGVATEFHRYMDLPPHIREMIREIAIEQELTTVWDPDAEWYEDEVFHGYIAPLASVSKEWQEDIESQLFSMIRIDPSAYEDAFIFQQLFKDKRRRRYLEVLDITLDDRLTGPWYTDNGILQISQAMVNVRMCFDHLNSWGPDKVANLAINFVSLALNFADFDKAPRAERSIRTTSLWTDSRLEFLGNTNLASDKSLWAIWSESPKNFHVAESLTFPLDCVPLPATMAIIETMPNLTSCSFELAVDRWTRVEMARLADFAQHLPTLAPCLSELRIRAPHAVHPPGVDPVSGKRLVAALRDFSRGLRVLKIDGIFLLQDFFDMSCDGRDPVVSMINWKWPKIEKLRLGFITFGPDAANQFNVAPAGLLVAAGDASMAMPLLKKFEVSIWDDVGHAYRYFEISRAFAPGQDRESPGDCRVRLKWFTKVEEQEILSAWLHFLRAKARLIRRELPSVRSDDEDSGDDTSLKAASLSVYDTFPVDYRRNPFSGAALWNSTVFREA